MSNTNYTLEIVSHHKDFSNKTLRKYCVDGLDTVGAWGDEPFEIRFKNNTWQKVQVKLSLDGTDILTGKPATTDITKDMWVVDAYGTLNVKAWPETSNGGAAFMFTNAKNSVAVNTHGDLSSRGIIAAAVYVEGRPSFVIRDLYLSGDCTKGCSGDYSRGLDYNCDSDDSITFNSISSSIETSDSLRLNDSKSSPRRSRQIKSLDSLVSVGAGQHVDQKITYVTGLNKPTFAETVRVKYLWWDELKAELELANIPDNHASGFPADKEKQIMSIGKTPRIGSQTKQTDYRVNYSRI
ncbi:hypothetical protein UFOVP1290_402 [uncultured Caudovirales phage]|uniref:Uncharacterized protein n=1 Tax=uncultured Caudovirales phage TaxID=2100421 RepID=A0A6J5RLE8_9CAUD|nr:hypothetical protein UFOVP1290_402 [uncultured Caudovirales phage]